MKKMKIYILLLLVPLLLMGCIEKGKPASGISVEVNGNLGGYTWEQLQEMIDSSDSNYYTSKTLYNSQELKDLLNEDRISGKTATISQINTLTTYLEKSVYLPVVTESSTFYYTSSVTKIKDLNDTLITLLGIKDYNDLVEIRDELAKIIGDVTVDGMVSSLNSTINAVKKNQTKNPFYANAARLYYQFYGNIGTYSNINYLKTTYNIDINEINQDLKITQAKAVLIQEIANLNSNGEVKTSDVSITLLGFLKDLLGVYDDYLNDETGISIANVNSMRLNVRALETTILNNNSHLMTQYKNQIDTVYNSLLAKTVDSVNATNKKEEFLTHINAYYARNNEYDNSNYLSIHSKVINILEEYEYLTEESRTDDLKNLIKISVPW